MSNSRSDQSGSPRERVHNRCCAGSYQSFEVESVSESQQQEDKPEMSAPSVKSQSPIEQQPTAVTTAAATVSSNPMEEVDSGDEILDIKEHRNPMDEIDSGGEEGESPATTVVPSNTPVTADSGQGSPTMASSSESLSDPPDQQEQTISKAADTAVKRDSAEKSPAKTTCEASANQIASKGESSPKQNGSVATGEHKSKAGKKEEKKEEKKKSKKKEDKGIEYILRALNSLQSPEEKLAALCKKYADLHEEHRVLQSSFKTQQRTMTVIMREKDQLQAEHTKAVMAKSKLESICRELQKHNKMIKDESIQRAKEDDEKRKEISAKFSTTIGEIQSQMTDNSERNSKLRQENENLAAQLKAFIQQCEARDKQVEALQKQHDLEKQLAEAKLAQAQAIMKEQEERLSKERDLVMLKLTEQSKKTAIFEAQVKMYKDRYDEFEKLHNRSSETFQKYKTEMDKMTKRIKKLEKDGLQWKVKWENSNKALIEMVEARSKAEKETLTYVQKTKKLESLCRALQAELHGKKVPSTEETADQGEEKKTGATQEETPSSSTVPPNTPEASSSDPCSPDSCDPSLPAVPATSPESTLTSTPAIDASHPPGVPAPSTSSSAELTSPSSPVQETTATAISETVKKDGPSITNAESCQSESSGKGDEEGAGMSSSSSQVAATTTGDATKAENVSSEVAA